MKSLVQIATSFLLVGILFSCNQFTYSPHSKKKQQKEKPSVVLLDRIIEFRLENNSWPFSKEEFIGKGMKFKQAFAGFPYLTTTFKVIDNNTMTFYFSDHYNDVQNYKNTQLIDLNSYGGYVRFYKEGEKFIWKLKMN